LIRKDGKIKACGTTVRDWSRFQCLHIGLSTAVTVPWLRNEARQLRVRSASIDALSQCHQGSFVGGRIAVMFQSWLAPTMIHAFAHASAAAAAGIIGVCWRQRRSSARSHRRVRWPGRPEGLRRSGALHLANLPAKRGRGAAFVRRRAASSRGWSQAQRGAAASWSAPAMS